jgi:GDP-4-dehydro-6-deoxy-D-mannose reductase
VRRILVTGASGFVGRHLRVALRSAFPDAVLIAASRGGDVAGWDQSVTLDLLDQDSCAKAVASAAPDAVLHLAARAAVGESFANPMPSWQANLFGTLALAEAVRITARDALFVHVSSAEVYGLSFQAGKALAEDALMRPANPYAASKAAADLAIGEMALRGLRAVRVRPFNHTGAGQSDSFVVPNFARQVASIAAGKQEPVLRVGALDRWRDFLDVADVCAGYAAVLKAEDRLEPDMIFNLASGNPRRIGDILDTLLRLAQVEARIEAEETLLRPTDVLRTEGDASAAERILGWTPSTPWEVTLATVLADWKTRTG